VKEASITLTETGLMHVVGPATCRCCTGSTVEMVVQPQAVLAIHANDSDPRDVVRLHFVGGHQASIPGTLKETVAVWNEAIETRRARGALVV
jgi:hypothetical protein